MQCSNCGTQYPDDASNCPNCGAPAVVPFQQGQAFAQNQTYQQGQAFAQNQTYQQGQSFAQAPLSKKEFLHHPNLKKCASNIKVSAIILYVCAAISSIALIGGNLSSLIDIALIAGLALGIHLAQSRVCAILICIYSVFNMVISLIAYGTPSGWLILAAAIDAIIVTFQFQKAWKEYQQTGILPAAK